MAMSSSSSLVASLLLSLAFFVLLIHGWGFMRPTSPRNIVLQHLPPPRPPPSPFLIARRALSAKFDSLHHHHHHHHHYHHGHHKGQKMHSHPGIADHGNGMSRHPSNLNPIDDEIDPRYGVEKRLVPTGPNPLHH